MTTISQPLYPGSPAAVAAGCKCDPKKNQNGQGEPFNGGQNRRVYTALLCPMHSPFHDPNYDPEG